MKERTYKSAQEAMFCPNCHRKIDLPIRGMGNIKITGTMRIGCGHCRNGVAIIKGEEKITKEK